MHMKKRLTLIQMLWLQAYWVGLSIMWNSLHVIILPTVLLNYVPESQKNTYLGLLTFGGLIIAMVIQPIAGGVSDRWRSRWGRRRPMILIGTLADLIFLAFLGWAGGLVWLAIGYIGLQFTSNVAHGPAQGLMPDVVPEEQLGVASGFKNLMDMVGLIIASFIMGRLLAPEAKNALFPIGVVTASLTVGMVITLMGIKERSTVSDNPIARRIYWLASLRIDWRGQRSFFWLVFSRLIFMLGIYDLQAFLQYYIRDVLAVNNPVQLTGDLMAVITVALIILSMSGGWIGDRIGHRRVLWIASIVSSIGCVLLLWAHTPSTLLAFGSILGMGIGLFLTSNWALSNRLVPQNEAGKYMGLTNLATAGSGALGRLGGPLIDLLNNSNPGAFAGYTAMFAFGAVCTLGSAFFLVKVKEKD